MLVFVVVESGNGVAGERWKLPVLLPLLNGQWLVSPISVEPLVTLV